MNRAALFVLALALGPQAAVAQQNADRTRLDEFALPADTGARVEQLGDKAQALDAPGPAANDREVAIPGPAAQPRSPVAQLSAPAGAASPRQLSDAGQSRQLASGSVSSSNDSRPQAVAALVGTDRCDPQADVERLAECRHILELRAAEFAAVEPPKLSAEQALLAQNGELDEVSAIGSARQRVRLAAANNPDANEQSNQELAAIFLDREAAIPSTANPDTEHPDDDALAKALLGLNIEVPPPSSR